MENPTPNTITPEQSLESKRDRRADGMKAILIGALSPLLLAPTWGIGGAIIGSIGARDYEIQKNVRLGTKKLGYILASAVGLGFINPYTRDILGGKKASN
jgi:hypothetical protein